MDHGDPVVICINNIITNVPPLSTERCIYRVPRRLRQQNQTAYTPQVISIGPLHHGKEYLQSMEEHKSRYLNKFLQRYELSLSHSVACIRNLEERARKCYADQSIGMGREEFIQMILVDGVFIIEAFLREKISDFQDDDDDYIFRRPWMRNDVHLDMTLLENQLPFFVLEAVYNLAYPSPPTGFPSLLQLTHNFFKDYFLPPEFKDILADSNSSKHLTDFLRICQQPWSSLIVGSPVSSSITTGLIPSATKLHEAGVKFKVSSSKCLLDIRFTGSELQIPKLNLEDDSETFFRNLLAFEVCHCDSETYVTDYIDLMDGLINTPADVELLVQNGIITNCLGENVAVSALFNSLLKQVNVRSSYYGNLCRDLNAYCNVPRNRWKAILKRDYCSTPWLILSVVAAAILLILTLLQTIFSGMSLWN